MGGIAPERLCANDEDHTTKVPHSIKITFMVEGALNLE
jgi:hypothetical protein